MDTATALKDPASSYTDSFTPPVEKLQSEVVIENPDFESPVVSGGLFAEDMITIPNKKILGQHRETIREWWIGKVTEIDYKDKFFTAKLYDPCRSLNSIAEIDFSQAFEGDEFETQLFEGAEFAFYVLTIHGSGSPSTTIGMEFNTPYIWSQKDEEKAQNIFNDLFPDD